MKGITNPSEAKALLINDRKAYIDSFLEQTKNCIEADDYDAVGGYIMVAAETVQHMNGAIDYFSAAERIDEKDDLPRYNIVAADYKEAIADEEEETDTPEEATDTSD